MTKIHVRKGQTLAEALDEAARERRVGIIGEAAIAAATAVEAARLDERERCAKIAEAHKGSATKKRREKFGNLSKFGLDNGAEIQAEERGEDIAAEMIAKAIRAQGSAGEKPLQPKEK